MPIGGKRGGKKGGHPYPGREALMLGGQLTFGAALTQTQSQADPGRTLPILGYLPAPTTQTEAEAGLHGNLFLHDCPQIIQLSPHPLSLQ